MYSSRWAVGDERRSAASCCSRRSLAVTLELALADQQAADPRGGHRAGLGLIAPHRGGSSSFPPSSAPTCTTRRRGPRPTGETSTPRSRPPTSPARRTGRSRCRPAIGRRSPTSRWRSDGWRYRWRSWRSELRFCVGIFGGQCHRPTQPPRRCRSRRPSRVNSRRRETGCEPGSGTPARSGRCAAPPPSSRPARSSPTRRALLPVCLCRYWTPEFDRLLLLGPGRRRAKSRRPTGRHSRRSVLASRRASSWLGPLDVAPCSVGPNESSCDPEKPVRLHSHFIRAASPVETASHWIPIETGDKKGVGSPTMHATQRPGEAALFGRYNLSAYDEMFDRPMRLAPHYAPLFERLIELGPEELERRHKVADLTMRQQGITFTVYGREQGVERIIPFDPIPRLIAAGRVGPHRARAQAAGPRSQPFHSRRLSRAADPQGPGRPARAGLRRHRLPARMRRAAGARRRLHPCLRHRPDSRLRRQLPRPRGQRPHALGRELRAQEPPGDEAGLPAACSSNTTCGRSTTTPTTCWRCCARSPRRAATTRPSSS